MIYNYIEKTILRRAVIISNLFITNDISLETLAKDLNVSQMTIRNDLFYFSEQFKDCIDQIYTKTGDITIHFKEEIDLTTILRNILNQSLFLKYLFLTLMDEEVIPSEIARIENVSPSLAHKVCTKIRNFIDEEQLKDNELKKRMILICLSRYLNLSEVDSIFEQDWLDEAIQIASKLVVMKSITQSNFTQLVFAVYLFLDRATLYPLNIDLEKLLPLNVEIKAEDTKDFLPCDDTMSNEELEQEAFFLSLVCYYLYEPKVNGSMLNNHLNLQFELDQDNDIHILRKFIFSSLDMSHLVLRTNLFYYTLQKFITFQYIGFPLKLCFSYHYIDYFYYDDKYQSIVRNWNESKNKPLLLNDDISFEFFYHLYLLKQYSSIHKNIFIIASNSEQFHILYNILSTMLQDKTIIVDPKFYHSIKEIPQDNLNSQSIIVCDRNIQEKSRENIVPFSLNHVKEDLLDLTKRIYDL
ncbi:DeoR family transcriptional regulator [Catellicoccus marimammalium]|uniref:HTH deoR-type domain-containing protein n=1 Tax=Catellicoccus marimammalium M35/04/3 TaxID=1234409 RepID=K8Z7L7_9ENTE|nr:DeoR family transcriptional regulator [Catellicoccus marimammalium]EKU26989.1 hypothetical protein C683_0985 [Catellicoccus marimammalium M35/04/3]